MQTNRRLHRRHRQCNALHLRSNLEVARQLTGKCLGGGQVPLAHTRQLRHILHLVDGNLEYATRTLVRRHGLQDQRHHSPQTLHRIRASTALNFTVTLLQR
ncbi:hypothetical protein D3C72_1624850 [compost metagenome]